MSRWSWCDMETGEFGAGADETWRGGAVAAVRHAWDEVDQVSWSERGHLHEDVRRQSHLLLQIGIPAVCLYFFLFVYLFFFLFRGEFVKKCWRVVLGLTPAQRWWRGLTFFTPDFAVHVYAASSSCSTLGGVAQWLERRSVAGELFLIYAWSMGDMWPLCGLSVRY